MKPSSWPLLLLVLPIAAGILLKPVLVPLISPRPSLELVQRLEDFEAAHSGATVPAGITLHVVAAHENWNSIARRYSVRSVEALIRFNQGRETLEVGDKVEIPHSLVVSP